MKIQLKDLQFYSYQGVFSEERKYGNNFSVDINVWIKNVSFQTDDLQDTVDYMKLCDVVAKQMDSHSYLLEHIAEKIADKILICFQKVEKVKVKMRKLHPSVGSRCSFTAVVLSKKRKDISQK